MCFGPHKIMRNTYTLVSQVCRGLPLLAISICRLVLGGIVSGNGAQS